MRVDILTQQELERVERALKQPYNLIWRVGYQTGLRVSDILSLRVSDLSKHKIRIRERKTGKIRYIYIRTQTKLYLHEYADSRSLTSSDYVFARKHGGTAVARQSVYRAITAAGKAAGINKNIGTHTMRKSYAAEYIQHHNITDLQKRLNHKYIGDTIGYLVANYIIQGGQSNDTHQRNTDTHNS